MNSIIKNLVIIIVGIIILYSIIQYDTNESISEHNYYEKKGCYNSDTKFNRSVTISNDSNILDKCALIAKGIGDKVFGILNDKCLIGFGSELVKSNDCNNESIQVYEWKNNIIDIEYNINYPPYINLGIISKKLSSIGYSLIEINKVMKKYGKKFNLDESITNVLIKEALKYHDNSKKFYDDIILGNGYINAFKDGLKVNIIKVDKPITDNMLNLVYSKDDSLDTVLYKILMKVKLVYSLHYKIDNDLAHSKNIIFQILKRNNIKCNNIWNVSTFSDFINKDGVRDAIKKTLNITFIERDFNEVKQNVDLDSIKKINDINKTNDTNNKYDDHNWEEYCDLDVKGTKLVSSFKCVDDVGIRAMDDMCDNKQMPKPSGKCDSNNKSVNISALDKLIDIDS